MSEHSPQPSLDTLTYSREDSRARILAKPENEPVCLAIARAFGLSSPALLAKFDHAGWLPRMCQGSLLCPEQWELLSGSWPDSAMWDRISVYELQTLEHHTLESAFSSWPTVRATSGGGNRSTYQGAPYRPAIAQRAQNWPTARQEDGESCEFAQQATMWRTPDAPNTGGPRNRQDSIGDGHQVTVAEQAEHWQTPAADSFRSRGHDRKEEMGLDQQARFFPTPAARDHRTPNKQSYQERSGTTKGEQLQNFVAHSLPAPAMNDGQQSSEKDPTSRRRLNPQFVEWLMGFPPGWTEL